MSQNASPGGAAKRLARLILLGDVAKSVAAVIALLAGLLSSVAWLAEDKFWAYAEKRLAIGGAGGGAPCAHIPLAGHIVTAGAPGTWGHVTWRDVERLRDGCGQPQVIGVISNGGGYLHDAPLSILGVPLSKGVYDLSYRFFTHEEVDPGVGTFQVIVTFPDAVGGSPPAISPRLNITIPRSDTAKPVEE